MSGTAAYGRVEVSIGRIARDLGVDVETVRTATGRLAELGYLTLVCPARNRRPAVYHLTLPEGVNPLAD